MCDCVAQSARMETTRLWRALSSLMLTYCRRDGSLNVRQILNVHLNDTCSQKLLTKAINRSLVRWFWSLKINVNAYHAVELSQI